MRARISIDGIAATAAMHCQPKRCTHLPSSVPHFLVAQNLSSKQIAELRQLITRGQKLTMPKGVIGCLRVKSTLRMIFFFVCVCNHEMNTDTKHDINTQLIMYNYDKFIKKPQSCDYSTTDGCTSSSSLHVPKHIPHTWVQSLHVGKLRNRIEMLSEEYHNPS